MCRSIKTLFNFSPVATKDEINAAALQYVRKVSGLHQPSKKNERAFDLAVHEIAKITENLLNSLETNATPKNREIEKEKARQRSLKRFNK